MNIESRVIEGLKTFGCEPFPTVNSKGKKVAYFKTPDGQILKNIDDGETWLRTPWTLVDLTPIDWLHQSSERFVKELADIAVFNNESDLVAKGVYFLFLDGELQYVGKSRETEHRIVAHKRDGKVFDEVRFITGIPDMFLEAVEMFYIHKLKPPLNTKYLPVSECFKKYLEEL